MQRLLVQKLLVRSAKSAPKYQHFVSLSQKNLRMFSDRNDDNKSDSSNQNSNTYQENEPETSSDTFKEAEGSKGTNLMAMLAGLGLTGGIAMFATKSSTVQTN